MNSFLISICLLFSNLPFCDVNNMSNTDFAKSFNYDNFQKMQKMENRCLSEALRITSERFNCNIDNLENVSEKLEICNLSDKSDIKQIIKIINSNEFENYRCNGWLIGWDDNHMYKEYKRRKLLND